MPETTNKLKIPIPLSNEVVSRAAKRAELLAIDDNAASQEQADRPFFIKVVSYDASSDRINGTLGPGRATFNGSLVFKSVDSAFQIDAPIINTNYYIYLKNDGTFYTNTTGVFIPEHILLWQLAIGTTKSAITVIDKRSEIVEMPGYIPANQEDIDTHLGATNPHSQYALGSELSYHTSNINNPHDTTAAQIGAVNKSGDTMTGHLVIANSAPQLILDETDSVDPSGKRWFLGVDGNEFWIGEDTTSSANRRLTVKKGGELYAGDSGPKIWTAGNLPNARNIYLSIVEPTVGDGIDGEVWLKYE